MTSEAMLERRYRQLLRLYPREHRREYEEEMIGVLLAGVAPGRTRPGPREVLDLVTSALTVRWSRRAHSSGDGHRAARAVQLFGAILLLAVSLRRVVMGEVAALRYADFVPHVAAHELVRPGAWALVLLLVLAGWRWAAVPAALAGLIAEVPPLALYRDTPARVLDVYWILVAAAVVTLAGLLVATAGRGRPAGEGRLPRGTAAVVSGGLLVVAGGAGSVLVGGSGLLLGGRLVPFPVLALYAVAGLLVVVGVLRLPPPVVRRVVVAAVPVVVAWPLIRVGFGDLVATNMRSAEPALLGPVQWTALAVVPLAATWVAATLNRRFERSRTGSPSV
ncbi:hypothetical protein [Actinoplanes auranticolor]|uniref:Uncharacterized protein n=1 Tax=Actinoplanes auranticolor TaxID=47988 RepID=A0A919SGX9_9ACTN|nr:hypothetical protein [Actinoplanes auranticolor]GIM72525.1 hypothetical protein Aau02nite_51420 [Actinoplanes auranticolor]